MSKLHPFEKAGLGKAPFKCVKVTTNLWTSGCGQVTKPGGSCHYCGTGILYEYHIEGADGSHFIVGSDCVAKTGGHSHVEGFKSVKSAHMAEKRSVKRKAAYEARQAKWAAEAAVKRAAFDAAHPGMYETLKALGEKSFFFKDLAYGIERWGSLTERQLAAVERILAERAEQEALKAGSNYVGREKTALTDEFKILKVMSWQSDFYPFPMSYLHIMEAGGNLFTYKGSVPLGAAGERVAATFTVKGHEDYNGARQTALARPRKVMALSA